MKKIKQFSVLLLVILLMCGCGGNVMKKQKVLEPSVVANNMKLYLLDKYDEEFEISRVARESEGEEYFVGVASNAKEEFFVRTDIYSEEFKDARCVEHYKGMLDKEIKEQVKLLWGNANVETGFSFYDYVPENEWDNTASLSSFIKAESPIIALTIDLVVETFEYDTENEKIQQLIKTHVDDYIFAQYAIKYTDKKGAPQGTYYISVFEESGVPTVEEIGERYNE